MIAPTKPKKSSTSRFFKRFNIKWSKIRTRSLSNRAKHADDKMREILNNARPYGIMSSNQKIELLKLIQEERGIPNDIRRDVWMLATGAQRVKMNNPNYYQMSNNPERVKSCNEEKKSFVEIIRSKVINLLIWYRQLRIVQLET